MYGLIKAIDEDNKNYCEASFDDWLQGKGIKQDRTYKRLTKDEGIKNETKTLPKLIRNVIHNPDNKNKSYCSEDLR